MYAELHCLSNFSFLRGASRPEELVEQAAKLGYRALAITDECSLAGIVRAHSAAEIHGIQLIVGSEFTLTEGVRLVILAPSKRAYQQLSTLITLARSKSPKGEYQLSLKQCVDSIDDCLVIWSIGRDSRNDEWAPHLQRLFYNRLWMGITLLRQQDDARRYQQYYELAREHRIPMLACGAVLMHQRQRKSLQDVLTATRLRRPLHRLGQQILANGENYLRPVSRLRQVYPQALLDETLQLAERCHFNLRELRYRYPDEVIPPGYSAAAFLRELTEAGAAKRWPEGTTEKVHKQIEYELSLIGELEYEHYFLTVYDIVQFARNRQIL